MPMGTIGTSVRVIGRVECGTCFDDHYVLRCEACGAQFDHYIGGGKIECVCGADCAPTEEQHARWERWTFDKPPPSQAENNPENIR